MDTSGLDHNSSCETITEMDALTLQIIHDLRNPLCAIHTAAEMLMDPGLSPPQVRRLVKSMYCASRRSQELLQHFREGCQLKSRGRRPCDLVELISTAIARVSSAAASRSIDIRQFVPADLVIMLDPRGIESVLDNLLMNAIEALPDGGKIWVSGRLDAELAIVEVRDTGPGVCDEIRHKLFRPFATVGKKNGLGLGLALSAQTVRNHGGRMWLKSESGRGACFGFSLPVGSCAGK
jgi:signal transduction histidine kinase